MGDVLLAVDGVSVSGETPDEVARRVVGPEGQPITVSLRIRRRDQQPPNATINVTLIRQQVFSMSERLISKTVGLGVELGRVDGGFMNIRSLSPGGGAVLSGKLIQGDVIVSVDGYDLATLPPTAERPQMLLGAPYSRLTLGVVRGGAQRPMLIDLVRTVPLVGEYLLKHAAYRNALVHAILPPAPPAGRRQGDISPSAPRSGEFRKMDIGSLDSKFDRAMDPCLAQELTGMSIGGSNNMPSTPGFSPQQPAWRGHNAGVSEESSFASEQSIGENDMFSSRGMSTAGSSVESTSMSRSSTGSRDSIAMSIRQIFGAEDKVDAVRSVEGREATFSNDWVHQGNPRLLKNKMANAGFIFTPDEACRDKVTCVYCGLELGMWEPGDDPWLEHQEGSPGCSFWRKSTSQGERISRDLLFTGYGSPMHSFQRLAGQDVRGSLTNFVSQNAAVSNTVGGDCGSRGTDGERRFAF